MNVSQLHQKFIVTVVCYCFYSIGFAQNPLFIPPTLEGPVYDLNLAASSKEFLPNTQTPTFGINGNYLGPTLIMNKGETVQIYVHNNLPNDTTTMHWHGMHLPAAADGGPSTLIFPGMTWSPSWEILNAASTMWYHPHPHEKTRAQVNMGLAGMIIIRDAEEAALDLPCTYGVDDIPLILQDRTFDSLGIFEEVGLCDTMLVNGTYAPYLEVPAQMIRFRALNGSNSRVYNIGLNDSSSFVQIATDLALLETPLILDRIRVATGERAEFILNLLGREGDTITLVSYANEMPEGVPGGSGVIIPNVPGADSPLNNTKFSILTLVVTAPTPNPVTSIPTNLTTHDYKPNINDVVKTRPFVFTSSTGGAGGPFHINGVFFNHHVINEHIKVGDTEIWELENNTLLAHPFHIHDEEFYILDRNGMPPPPNEKGPKDVVLTLPGETVRFLVKFEDFADDSISYMYHCHILGHEDDGMMGHFKVVESLPTAIDKINHLKEFSLSPNPSKGQLFVKLIFDRRRDFTLDIFSASGKKIRQIKTSQVQSFENEIDLSNQPPGVYFFRLDSEGEILTKRFILLAEK